MSDSNDIRPLLVIQWIWIKIVIFFVEEALNMLTVILFLKGEQQQTNIQNDHYDTCKE